MLPWWLSGPDGKELPAVQETWVPSLGWKDSLEKGMATRFSILVENSTDRGSQQATVHGVAKSHTCLSDSHTHTLPMIEVNVDLQKIKMAHVNKKIFLCAF